MSMYYIYFTGCCQEMDEKIRNGEVDLIRIARNSCQRSILEVTTSETALCGEPRGQEGQSLNRLEGLA